MFKEFNVEFQNVEMIGGADNLLENTKVTKVVMSGDNKMSSLDSTFKNCSELDNIQGELDLNDVSDIDNILEDTELVKRINLKNVNNENISADNSFPNVEEISIGGDSYNKKAMQNVIASKDWTFDNLTYSGIVGDNIVTKEVNVIDDNKLTIKDTLEQKARGFEVIGQTYENLVVGNGEVTLLDELTLESIDGSPNEFNPHIEQPVCVETIEGETYQNLVNGKGEYKLTDTFSTTWTESNNSIDNPPSMIEIPEIWGNTIQDENDLNIIQSVGDLYVDENGNPILDEEGNEQYKLEIESVNNINLIDSSGWTYAGTASDYIQIIKLEPNTKYTYYGNQSNNTSIWHSLMYCDAEGNVTTAIFSSYSPTSNVYKFTTGNDNNIYIRAGWSASPDAINKNHLPMLVKGSTVLPYIEGTGNNQSNKTTILMPQPLRKVANGRDRLYWDLTNKKYYIEKNIFSMILDGSQNYTFNWRKDGYVSVRYPTSNPSKMFGNTIIANRLPVGSDCYSSPKEVIYTAWDSNIYIVLKGEYDFNVDWLVDNPITIYYYGDSSQTVETKILEKPSLETYSPKTYITTNTEIQPSQMNIANKQTTIIPMFLNENKKYTVKFNCTKKGISPIKINLGGAVKEINPIIGENVIEIVTSSAIDKKELVLSGEGNIVEDVYIIADNMSTGDLQEDGTYKIDLSTSSEAASYEISIIANNPLGVDDKLYWNKSNKRYEIDRNGEIEVPTVVGDIVDLPRLYQKEDTVLTIESGNIKPSSIKVEYLDID